MINISNKKAYILEIIGFLIYVVSIGLAMLFYPGGSQIDPSAPGYTFWFNTFSDSGRVYARNGELNLISLVFFSIAYCTFSLTIIPFYLVVQRIFEEDSLERKSAKVGGYLGILSSIGFIGVVFTPADILYLPHIFFAFLAYIAIFFTMCFFSFSTYRSGKISKLTSFIFILFTAIFFVFLMMALSSLILDIRELLTIGQKIGRFSILVGFSVLTYGVWKLENA